MQVSEDSLHFCFQSRNINQMEEKKQTVPVIILAVVILVFLALLILLYFQTKNKVAPTITPSPTPLSFDFKGTFNSQSSKEPKTYTNSRVFYSFSCPANSKHTDAYNNLGIAIAPFLQDICSDEGNASNKVEIYSISPDAQVPNLSQVAYEKEFTSKTGKIKVLIRGGGRDYFNQVVASFKFTE